MSTEKGLNYEFLMRLDGFVSAPHLASDGRAVFPVTGGTFEGPKIKGTLVHGADYGKPQSNGSIRVDARVLLKTDDDCYIYAYYDGVALEKDGKPAYFYTCPVFEASGKYAWLNDMICIGKGVSLDLAKGVVSYEIYAMV